MKICHVIYIPRLSGAEILVRDLAIQHRANRHEITVLAIAPPEDSFTPILESLQRQNIRLVIPCKQLGKLERLRFLMRGLNSTKPNIIVAHAVIPSIYARLALQLSQLRPLPVVSILHDASQNDYASNYFRILESFLKPPKYVIPLTSKALDNYKRCFGNRTKLKVIPNGVDIRNLQLAVANRHHIRKTVFNVSDEPIFLQVGRFNHNKQQHLSIAAFIKACQCNECFNGRLFLAGLEEEESYFSKLQRQVEDAQLQERIIFLGPRSDIPDLLAAADIYLMPSAIEAHSIAFLEALASGITMIISDIPAFEEGKQFPGVVTLNPGSTNFFARKLLDCTNQVYAKKWERDLSEFSIEKTASTYLKVFRAALSPL